MSERVCGGGALCKARRQQEDKASRTVTSYGKLRERQNITLLRSSSLAVAHAAANFPLTLLLLHSFYSGFGIITPWQDHSIRIVGSINRSQSPLHVRQSLSPTSKQGLI